MCPCTAQWWRRRCVPSLKRHSSWKRADRGCVIKLWNPFLQSSASAKWYLSKSYWENQWRKKKNNPSRAVKYKDWGTQSPKSNLWKLVNYFGDRMVYFPFHVCFWILFQTWLHESFVWLKQLVVLLPLWPLEIEFCLLTMLSLVILRSEGLWEIAKGWLTSLISGL